MKRTLRPRSRQPITNAKLSTADRINNAIDFILSLSGFTWMVVFVLVVGVLMALTNPG